MIRVEIEIQLNCSKLGIIGRQYITPFGHSAGLSGYSKCIQWEQAVFYSVAKYVPCLHNHCYEN